jgi:hypothetical protein
MLIAAPTIEASRAIVYLRESTRPAARARGAIEYGRNLLEGLPSRS